MSGAGTKQKNPLYLFSSVVSGIVSVLIRTVCVISIGVVWPVPSETDVL